MTVPRRLGEMCLKIGSGATPRGGKEVYVPSGIALIRSQNVYNDGFRFDGMSYITNAHAEQLAGVTVATGDVLLNITGDSVARACQAPPDVIPARVNQHVAIIRPHPDELDPRYLRYVLVSPEIQAHMLNMASGGGTRNALTKAMIENFQIPWRPLLEQRAIAHILGTLDDKIELNRRMNETLEAIARALFRSWFVDFDPVRAKAAGQQPTGMDAEIAALFPDSFEESALGEIPRGWRESTFGEIATHKRIGVDPRSVDPSTPYIGLEHMPRRSIALGEWDLAEAVDSQKSAFAHGDILFGKLRPYFHKVGIASVDGVCSTDIIVISPTSPQLFGLALCHASSDEMVSHADASSGGTRMPRTSWTDLARYEIAVPNCPIASAFTQQIRLLTDAMSANILNARTLARTRDALLPILLSGEWSVSVPPGTR